MLLSQTFNTEALVMLTKEFLEEQHDRLLYRRKSKERILREGGQQSLSHTMKDLTRIDFALRRIEQGQYGICTNCGCPIGGKRLRAIPETPLCIHCAQERLQ